MKELKAYVLDKIDRKRQKLLGHSMAAPWLKTIGGQQVWVTDVLIRSDSELLRAVPIAENNRQIRNFVTEGTPVEVQRSQAGQFYISGLADTKKGDVVKKTYDIADEGLAFTEGWKIAGTGIYETGNGNTATPGTPATTTSNYSLVTIEYGDLDYGVTPYGAKEIIRT